MAFKNYNPFSVVPSIINENAKKHYSIYAIVLSIDINKNIVDKLPPGSKSAFRCYLPKMVTLKLCLSINRPCFLGPSMLCRYIGYNGTTNLYATQT